MLSKNKVKYIQSLRLKKNRQKLNKYIIEGEKMVNDYLKKYPLIEVEIWATNEWYSSYINERYVNDINDRELKSISSFKSPNKVLIVVDIVSKEKLEINDGWYIYLNDLQDPGNIGTILRSAFWFGLKGVILSPNCVDIYNTKVVQSSMSAVFSLDISIMSFEELLNLEPSNLIATAMDGTSISEYQFEDNGIIVLGNEGQGLPDSIFNKCKDKISIPSGNKPHAESLNVAVACSIIMSQI